MKIEPGEAPHRYALRYSWNLLSSWLGPKGYLVLGSATLLLIGIVWFFVGWPLPQPAERWRHAWINPIPEGDPYKFTVAVAEFERDPEHRFQQNLIDGLVELPFTGSFEVLSVPRLITSRGSKESDRQAAEQRRSIFYLNESSADILMWGSVLDDQGTSAKLYWLTASGTNLTERYKLEGLYELPTMLVDDLREIVVGVVLADFVEIADEGDEGRFVATRLAQMVPRLRRLAADLEPSEHFVRATIYDVLGNSLFGVGEKGGDIEALEESIEAFRQALHGFSVASAAMNKALTQVNLGKGLAVMGDWTGNTLMLEDAIEVFETALGIVDRVSEPLAWASAQDNLGTTLSILGGRAGDNALLEAGVAAHRKALSVFSPSTTPMEWAMAEGNLGTSLMSLGQRQKHSLQLHEAVTAYKEALKIRTRMRSPAGWASLQLNLGTVTFPPVDGHSVKTL